MFPRKLVFALAVLVLMVSLTSAFLYLRLQSDPSVVPQVPPQDQYRLKVAFPNLLFNLPVGLYDPGDGSNRLFVVEQQGIIRVFENSPDIEVMDVFLDLTDRVLYGGEQGLLGLAFPADFAQSGSFYVNYVAGEPRRTIVARYSVLADDPSTADPESEYILLEIDQPTAVHNGGQIAFGPDGFLYIGMGDGDDSGDSLGSAQSLEVLLGKILRIDVSSNANYTIPDDNPFVKNTQGYRGEIYAYGLRNPWRFSFDSQTEQLWVGDVGERRIEEINIIEKGGNYGWNILEGTLCFPLEAECNRTGLILPIWEYNHTYGYSITGGFVYRGSTLSALVGSYIYADFIEGTIWALEYNDTQVTVNMQLLETDLNISSFGVDQSNELYICAFDGKIYQLEPTGNTPPI